MASRFCSVNGIRVQGGPVKRARNYQLVVVGPVFRASGVYWQVCQCDCGSYALVQRGNFNATESCRACSIVRGGDKRRMHTQEESLVITIWREMVRRCQSPRSLSYENYGARGIRVCDEWIGKDGCQRFIEHIGPRPSRDHSVDRIDNNGNYEPGNVRWATRKMQNSNTRKNVFVEFYGKTMTLTEWCNISCVSVKTVRARIIFGWDLKSAIWRPVRC